MVRLRQESRGNVALGQTPLAVYEKTPIFVRHRTAVRVSTPKDAYSFERRRKKKNHDTHLTKYFSVVDPYTHQSHISYIRESTRRVYKTTNYVLVLNLFYRHAMISYYTIFLYTAVLSAVLSKSIYTIRCGRP